MMRIKLFSIIASATYLACFTKATHQYVVQVMLIADTIHMQLQYFLF